MITLYYASGSPFAWRVHLALEEKGLAYEACLLSFDRGELKSPGHAGLDENLGRNSFQQTAWLPPDPPTGHGPHLYVFQVFALDRKLDFEHPPSRKALADAMRDHVVAKGVLIGTYERT